MNDTYVLKNSLKILYADHPEILMMLDQISFDKLNVQWKQELFSRINPETYYLVEEFLASELYANYTQAVHAATLAMTRPLSDLMSFVLETNKGEIN